MHQVVANVLNNAVHAAGETVGGAVEVGCLATDGWVTIIVKDNGPGISDDALDHVFDPFYTTKPPGQGTGLGLSVAQEIAAQHGGRVDLKSEVGRGTEVSIRLPAS